MDNTIRYEALEFLHVLAGQPMCYALKSPDTELYEFGFGELTERENRKGKRKKIGTYTLHILCRFKVIWRNDGQRVDEYYEDTSCQQFHSDIKYLLGSKVRQIALSDKNDLWLDFGDHWIVFATFENREESWRFFSSNINLPHLVVSNSWLYFAGGSKETVKRDKGTA